VKKCICWCLSIIELKNARWNIESRWVYFVFEVRYPISTNNNLGSSSYITEQNQKAALNLTLSVVTASSLSVLLPTEPINREFCNGFWEFWSKNFFFFQIQRSMKLRLHANWNRACSAVCITGMCTYINRHRIRWRERMVQKLLLECYWKEQGHCCASCNNIAEYCHTHVYFYPNTCIWFIIGYAIWNVDTFSVIQR